MVSTNSLRPQYRTLRLILGDQLNARHSWFRSSDDTVLYVMAEHRQELTYTRHHIQKACAFLKAMRRFAEALRRRGHHVRYFTLDDGGDSPDLPTLLNRCILYYQVARFEHQYPDEYRLDMQLADFRSRLHIESDAVDTEHFLTSRQELTAFFDGRKSFLMESFYRKMRRRTGILMQGAQPMGDRWNFDACNRKRLPRDHEPGSHLLFSEDVSDIVAMLKRHGINTIGEIEANRLEWPTTRSQSLELLEHFVRNHLHSFGTYQDAMTDQDTYIHHSRLSFSLNSKMLNPMEVVDTVIRHWTSHRQSISLAQVEGYVRQIIGWREYMRGVYWAKMPGYATSNFLRHHAALPSFYWDGRTRMHCLAHTIRQSLRHAYAHHIQRLMVTGNFALLAGVDPDEVDRWYLGIYIDAIEWVEVTNTRGMSQFADGGLLATKPYVSSGNYIARMSDYCRTCHYSVKLKSGDGSCPFNSLYWHFIDRHQETLRDNLRIGMICRGWLMRTREERLAILDTARNYLARLNEL